MRCKCLVYIGLIVLVLILAGCAKKECKKDVDCTKPHFTSQCIDNKCSYKPIPNECGNRNAPKGVDFGAQWCETGENKCTCPADCGTCTGKVGKYLVQKCNAQNDCVEDTDPTLLKPITLTREVSVGGTKLRITSNFVQPFNTKKDQLELEFGVNMFGQGVSDLKITRLELTGMTPDKRTIALADKPVELYLYEGTKAKEKLIISFPAAEKDGELTNLNLKLYVDYLQTSGGTSMPKSTTAQHPYQAMKFVWTAPEKAPGCPASCDDGNPGTQDICGQETNFFCENRPIAGACGNGVCDGTENKCTCAADCGSCTGGGTFVTRDCVNNACIAQLKQGVAIQPQSVFDEREFNVFTLQNNYKFNKPLNVKTDKFTIDFTLYQKHESISLVRIKDVRVLEGTQEFAYLNANQELTTAGQKATVELVVPPQGMPEQEHNLAVRVWYEYLQNNQTKQGDYTKPLGKIILLSTDV